MGLIANLTLFFTGVTKFFNWCQDFFGLLPFAIRILIFFIFGTFLFFGIMKMVMRVGA